MVLIWMKDEVLRTFSKGLRFIRSPQDQFISKLVRLREKKVSRRTEGRIIVMTKKTIDQLVEKGIKIRTLGLTVDPRMRKPTFAPTSDILEAPWDAYTADKYIAVNVDVVRRMFSSRARPDPHELWAEVDWPVNKIADNPRRILALDFVNDAEQFGYLIRTARAFNWDGAYLLPRTCDIYEDHAQRISRGAVFDCPIAEGNYKDFAEYVKKNDLTPVIALPPRAHDKMLKARGWEEPQALDGFRWFNWPKDRPLGQMPEKLVLVAGTSSRRYYAKAFPNAIGVQIPLANGIPSLGISNAGTTLMHKLTTPEMFVEAAESVPPLSERDEQSLIEEMEAEAKKEEEEFDSEE